MGSPSHHVGGGVASPSLERAQVLKETLEGCFWEHRGRVLESLDLFRPAKGDACVCHEGWSVRWAAGSFDIQLQRIQTHLENGLTTAFVVHGLWAP